MSKHTLGQWKLHDMESNVIVGKDHLTIADVNAKNRNEEENQANAKLIASAPELLEACKTVVKIGEKAKREKGYDNEPGIWLEHIEAIRKMQKAIAKAEEV